MVTYIANIDEYLRRRGHILNRLLGIIRLTSSHDTLVDTDMVFDPELDESEFLDEEGILGNSSNSRGVSIGTIRCTVTWYLPTYLSTVFWSMYVDMVFSL
jgi:hypothetical protein